MTDEQRYIIQGRARDEAKNLKAEIATLRIFFDEYRETLQAAHSTLERFLSDPFARSPVGRPIIDHLNELNRKLSAAGFFEQTCEYSDKLRKLQKLEDEIKNF